MTLFRYGSEISYEDVRVTGREPPAAFCVTSRLKSLYARLAFFDHPSSTSVCIVRPKHQGEVGTEYFVMELCLAKEAKYALAFGCPTTRVKAMVSTRQ